MAVSEVTGIRNTAVAGALRVASFHPLGCRWFTWLTSVMVPRAGANGACRWLSERACSARALSGSSEVARSAHTVDSAWRLIALHSACVRAGDRYRVQWSTLTVSHSCVCIVMRLGCLRGSSATNMAHDELKQALYDENHYKNTLKCVVMVVNLC